jgi:glycosyltransferase involved in cell wall biosynthesis
MSPRLGVLDFHPIQYHVPLYRRLAERGRVRLDVLYLRDAGYRPVMNEEFGVLLAWNIDLLSGYQSSFLPGGGFRASQHRAGHLVRWLRGHDAVVIHGHSDRGMLFAVAACRALGIPYLLRGDAQPEGQATGIRGRARDRIAHAVVSRSAGGLAAGQLNHEFYRKYGARRIVFAPYSVDNDRFAAPPAIGREKLLAQWGLPATAPVLMFCGKLDPRKRPLDLTAAVGRLGVPVTTLVVGNGALAGQVRAALPPGRGAVTGFVNQADLPPYYHAADILVLPSSHEPWGLVVNEAMATGTLPVVSDRVGAAPDLVDGIGEVYPCGDVTALAQALRRALDRLDAPGTRDRVRKRVARYGVDATAAAFEQAALAASGRRS